jgi:hypothetical protein
MRRRFDYTKDLVFPELYILLHQKTFIRSYRLCIDSISLCMLQHHLQDFRD